MTRTLRSALTENLDENLDRDYLLFLTPEGKPRLLTVALYQHQFTWHEGYIGPYHAIVHSKLLDVPLYLGE